MIWTSVKCPSMIFLMKERSETAPAQEINYLVLLSDFLRATWEFNFNAMCPSKTKALSIETNSPM